MAKLQNIDLGTVISVEPIYRKTVVDMEIAKWTFKQNMDTARRHWRIIGFLTSPTKAAIEDLQNIANHGLIALLDLDDLIPDFIAYGKLEEAQYPRVEETEADIYNYELMFNEQPAIGVTHIQTANAYLHDIGYRANLTTFNPILGKFDRTFSANRLNLEWRFYLDNDAISIQTLIAELQCGDDISKFKLYGYKTTWELIGDWGGADAWDAIKTWVDYDTISHNFRANKGNRGDVLSGIGTISRTLGCKKRVLFNVTNMLAQGAVDTSNDVGSDQLLLKAILEHTETDTNRPYPRITYVDGSLDDGEA